MFQLKRNRQLRQKLADYFTTGQTAVDTFLAGMKHYIHNGPEELKQFVVPSHRQESACDTIRFGIEEDLFEKALMPALREDIMLLLEEIDRMINQSEDVLRQIHIQLVLVPDFLMERLGRLSEICHKACTTLLQQGSAALEYDSHAKEYRDRVDALESQADHLEQAMLMDLFRSDMPTAEKILARDVIVQVSHLADLAEDAADFLVVFRLKREI